MEVMDEFQNPLYVLHINAEKPKYLSPAEHASLCWTHNRTSRFPASGFPAGFTAMHATGPLGAGVGGTERRVLDE
jgi:hypothetical protein